MQELIKVSFQIQILRKEWHTLDVILNDEYLIHQYFEEAKNRVVYGGFFIEINGVKWNEEEAVGSVEYAETWVYGLIDLLKGKNEVQVLQDDQSHPVLKKIGDKVQLEDANMARIGKCLRVYINLQNLVKSFIPEIRKLNQFIKILREKERSEEAKLVIDGFDILDEQLIQLENLIQM